MAKLDASSIWPDLMIERSSSGLSAEGTISALPSRLQHPSKKVSLSNFFTIKREAELTFPDIFLRLDSPSVKELIYQEKQYPISHQTINFDQKDLADEFTLREVKKNQSYFYLCLDSYYMKIIDTVTSEVYFIEVCAADTIRHGECRMSVELYPGEVSRNESDLCFVSSSFLIFFSWKILINLL